LAEFYLADMSTLLAFLLGVDGFIKNSLFFISEWASWSTLTFYYPPFGVWNG
jgi:hypothetical protein